MSKELIKLYRTRSGCVLTLEECAYSFTGCAWEELTTREDLSSLLADAISRGLPRVELTDNSSILAPIGLQEVWAAGVTYYRSRDARMEESKSTGGGDFYDRVYSAKRPELFFKATPSRVVGPGETVAIRSDAKWSVPEPELVLLISPSGKILGYTIGNDMSSRDIEGDNPLYLPQAKVYSRCCALGPCIVLAGQPPRETEIKMEIFRSGALVFSGEVVLSAMKREFSDLVDFLYRDNIFPNGCFLFTGTGIVPPDSFTLKNGDEVRIAATGVGTLVNAVG